MPYLSLRTSAPLDAAKTQALHRELAALIAVIPGKNENNCMIDIEGGCALFMRSEAILGAVVDLRMFGVSPMDAKQSFMEGLCEILREQLGVEKQNVYCNMAELEHWGSGGNFR